MLRASLRSKHCVCVLFMSVCFQVNESECFRQKNELGQIRLANRTTLRQEKGEAGGKKIVHV